MYARRFYRQSPPPGYSGVAFSSPPAEESPAAPAVREEAPVREPKKEQPTREENALAKGADTLRAVFGALGAALSPTKIPPAAKAAAAPAPTGGSPAMAPTAPVAPAATAAPTATAATAAMAAPPPQTSGPRCETKLPPVFGRSSDGISSHIGERPHESGRNEFSPRGLKPASRDGEALRSDPGGLMADYIKRQQAVNAALAGEHPDGAVQTETVPDDNHLDAYIRDEYARDENIPTIASAKEAVPEEPSSPVISLPEDSPLQEAAARPDDTGRPEDAGRSEKLSPLQSLFHSRFTFEELLLMGAALLLASGQADDEALLLFSLILILMGK